MLNMLRRIVQEVNAASSLTEALHTIVRYTRRSTKTQACTVFLVDKEQQEFVLMATDGLNKEAIGKVRFGLTEGLVGYIAQREEPINVEDAPSHPHFLRRTEVGEERFRGCLGVPIIHHRRLLGVLMVQHEHKRRFDESEEAFLITLSAQLAAVIAHAEATGTIRDIMQSECVDAHERRKTALFEGVQSSPGIGIGKAMVVYPPADLDAVPDRQIEDIDTELEIFNLALMAARNEIHALGRRLAANLPIEEQTLFDAYAHMLDSRGLGYEVAQEIYKGCWAQAALRNVSRRHLEQLELIEDSYLKERAIDIRDLCRRILFHLQANQPSKLEYPEQTILVSEELTPAAIAEVPEGKLVGIISAGGTSNSHIAILARALGIPAVMGMDSVPVSYLDGRELIVDGYHGHVFVSPSVQLLQEFTRLAAEQKRLDKNLEALRTLPAETPDGHRMAIFVNVGLIADANLSLTAGAEGVGLYRTEVPFMLQDRFPAEEEQRVVYRQLLHAFAPRPVIMRTLDIGGDKPLSYFPFQETNPFLGWRGIRISLDHPEVFLVQVRAMLKANADYNNLRILLPMISSVTEVEDALRLLHQAHQEVLEEGVQGAMPPIGVMIEIPSAVYLARELARRVDFLSIGTNDLTQYLLAVDRNNARVAMLYDCLHPAVLRALIQVREATWLEGKEVSICGEMAADPVAMILLLAMGFDVLSMSSNAILRIKWLVRSFPLQQAKILLEQALQMDNPKQIRTMLESAIHAAGLGSLI